MQIAVAADAIVLVSSAAIARNLKTEEVSRVAFFSSLIFLSSLIHFPIGPTSLHLSLLGMSGVILKWFSPLAVFLAIFFQAFIFQHGGILAIGMNTIIMRCGAVMAFILWKISGRGDFAGFVAGFCGVLVPSLLLALIFHLLNYGKGVLLLIAINLLLSLIEGILTLYILRYLKKMETGVVK